MNQTPQKKKRVKWVLQSSPTSLKVLLGVLVLVSLLTITALWQAHRAITAYTAEIQQSVADLEYANSNLQDKVDNPDSAQNIIDVAKDHLGLVEPDTVIVGPAGE